jgi:peptide/nickel transport system substrate-binding protein
LDELGLDQRDSEGWRTLPSGKSFVLQINAPQNKGYRVDSAEIIAKNLQKVGINAPANILEKTLYVKRYQAAQLPVFINGNYEGMNPLNRPHFYWPVSRNTRFAPMSGSYYGSNGDDGVKPEGDMAELVDIYEKVKDELDDEKRNAMIRETMELHAENLWGVGVLGYGPAPATKSNRMKNMPDNTSNLGWNPVVVIPETFYIEE